MRRSSELSELVSRNMPGVVSEFTGPLARMLISARDACGGDLEKFLVLLVISLRSSIHPEFKSMTPPPGPLGTALPSFGINVASIAASTGIPKETVRRKVDALAETGWVVREGGEIKPTPAGYIEISPVRDEIVKMYVGGYRAIERLLSKGS